MRFYFFLILFLIGLKLQAQNKRPIQYQKDFELLITELQLKHQGLYNYNSEIMVNMKIDSLRNLLNQPLSKLEFYKLLRYTIALTNEGHTSLSLPKLEMLRIGISKSFLPVSVKFVDEGLVIAQFYGKGKTSLASGDRIISINEVPVNTVIDEIFPYIATDGFNQTSKFAWSSGINFALLYRLVHGKKKKFVLQVQEFQTEKIKTISLSPIRYTRYKKRNAAFLYKNFDYEDFNFEQINDSIAYLSIPGFGEDGFNYADYYRYQFKRIDSLNIRNLILDIQYNGGGTEGNENLLFNYLTDQEIIKYKKVSMLPDAYRGNENDPDFLFDQWSLKSNEAVRGEFTLSSRYYSDLGYSQPDSNLVFKGKLFVLISGKTFSGGAEFASLLRMSGRGIFIGEETGGAYEGNVSGYSEKIKLQNSKIEVRIPTVHFQINVNPPIKGRGIIPEYPVIPSWSDYIHEINTLKNFAVDLILSQ